MKTRPEIIAILLALGIHPALLSINDNSYVLPDENWLATTFAEDFSLDQQPLGGYDHIGHDCDKYASAAIDLAHRAYIIAKKKTAEGIAFGLFYYQKDDGGGHAINVAITEKGVEFWEPQTQKFVTLSPTEIVSCKLCVI